MKTLSNAQVCKSFGSFKWHNCPQNRGAIVIEGDWVKRNIVYDKDVPVIGRIRCHKEIIINVWKVFYTIEKEGLAGEIDVADWNTVGGCFVPRHKSWDNRRGLSRHSWGIALDINVKDNPYGKVGKQHPVVISIFEKNGFIWGGRWRTRDDMHFEVSSEWRPLKPILTL